MRSNDQPIREFAVGKEIREDFQSITEDSQKVQVDVDAPATEWNALGRRADQLQMQLNIAVLAGDSSVAVAQATVRAHDHDYGNLKGAARSGARNSLRGNSWFSRGI
ncbi:hypothetical protein DQG13_17695 [Paenibacillus sp. YN15]|nr:hypothetical protein DQG13_17695 [Paenibacillus sp. YN15]